MRIALIKKITIHTLSVFLLATIGVFGYLYYLEETDKRIGLECQSIMLEKYGSEWQEVASEPGNIRDEYTDCAVIPQLSIMETKDTLAPWLIRLLVTSTILILLSLALLSIAYFTRRKQ